MPKVEVVSETPPAPRSYSGKKVRLGVKINLVDSRNGNVVRTIKTPAFLQNERQIRKGLKY
jgi:hypothetical protein